MSGVLVQKSITAENTFSNACSFSGMASFRLSGTWVATAYLYRSIDAGATWDQMTDSSGNVLSWTGNVIANITEASNDNTNVQYRFGVPTGSFTSGTVVGEIRQ